MLQSISSTTNASTMQGTTSFSMPLTNVGGNPVIPGVNLESALNYLLQFLPPDVVRNAMSFENHSEKIRQQNNAKKLERLALPTLEGLEIVEIKDILYCEANSNYTIFHFVNQPKIMVSKTLKEIASNLSEQPFFRVHQSYLVNLKHIQKYVKGSGGYLILAGGASVNVSKSNKEALVNRLLQMR